MESGITTIYFDGQYWVALAERFLEDGTHLVAKFTMGPEPTYNDILEFYTDVYPRLTFRECAQAHLKIKTKRMHQQVVRHTTKAQEAFNEAQKQYLQKKKKLRRDRQKEDERKRFQQKSNKRKQKRRGH